MVGEPLPHAPAVNARYFDGRQALARDVSLTITGDRVVVGGVGVTRDEPLASVVISERIGRTPRFVRFHDQAYCEVVDQTAFDQILAAAGVGQGSLPRWEQNSKLAAVLVVLLIAIAVATYRYGLPLAAESVAKKLPYPVLNTISRQTLALLDRSIFSGSKLPTARQRQITHRFLGMMPPGRPQAFLVMFRSSKVLGPNAMALPNGTIVVTDGLVELAATDDEVLAVLAHEAGHVEERHGMRNVIQSSVLSIFVSWYLGDVNAIVAAAPAILMEAKYSRDLEREADDYAATFLRTNGLPATLLGDMLEKLEGTRTKSGRDDESSAAYLSSHPTTKERIERLKAGGR